MKVRFIVNPVAGGRDSVERITEAVTRLLHSEDGIFEIRATGAMSATELSKEALDRGYEAVFACGGDGTVNEVATPLVGTKTALGIIPGGSGNGFATALGIHEEPEEAIAVLKNLRIKEVDVGVICGRYFFSTAGCGFDAHLSKKYNEGFFSRRMRGLMPYFPIAVREYFFYKPLPVTIKTENYSTVATPFILTVANTSTFGGGVVIAPDASPFDGLLDLCFVPAAGFFKTAVLGLKLLSGEINEFKGYRCIKAEKIEILGRNFSILHADGEPFEWKGGISISVLPKKLKVLT